MDWRSAQHHPSSAQMISLYILFSFWYETCLIAPHSRRMVERLRRPQSGMATLRPSNGESLMTETPKESETETPTTGSRHGDANLPQNRGPRESPNRPKKVH